MAVKNKLITFIGLGSGEAALPLYAYIKTHPELCFPKIKTNFFSHTKIYAKGVDWYEGQFKDCDPDVKYGELANDYLRKLPAAALIAKTYPEAKLLAVVENPLISVRMFYVLARRQREIPANMSLSLFIKQNPDILNRAKYGRQLMQYFSLYSPKDLLVLTATDVTDDPLKMVEKVFKHIEVDDTFVPLSLKHLAVDDEEEQPRIGIIKKTFILIRKSIIKTYTKIAHIIRPPVVEIEVVEMARKIPLSPELEKFLKEYYQKDVQTLSALLHRDLGAEWGI